MFARLPRSLPAVLCLLAAQGLAVLLYLGVERHRAKRNDRPFLYEELGTARPAHDLVFSLPDGSARRLSDLRGKTVLLHFWASWCPPCREEMPGLLEMSRELDQDGGIEVVAVTLDQNWDAVREFFGGDIPSEVVQDKGGQSTSVYGLNALPDTYVVDADGMLRIRFGGARDWRSREARDLARRFSEQR